MKTKLLFLSLLAILLHIDVTPSFAKGQDTLRQIYLKDITKIPSRSEVAPPSAFTDDSSVLVEFPTTAEAATLTVKNAETGEVVYASVEMGVEDTKIDLSKEAPGNYIIEIDQEKIVSSGEFTIE